MTTMAVQRHYTACLQPKKNTFARFFVQHYVQQHKLPPLQRASGPLAG